MAFLTLHEMIPLAFEYAGQKQSVKAVFCGMAFMSARYLKKRLKDMLHLVSIVTVLMQTKVTTKVSVIFNFTTPLFSFSGQHLRNIL